MIYRIIKYKTRSIIISFEKNPEKGCKPNKLKEQNKNKI